VLSCADLCTLHLTRAADWGSRRLLCWAAASRLLVVLQLLLVALVCTAACCSCCTCTTTRGGYFLHVCLLLWGRLWAGLGSCGSATAGWLLAAVVLYLQTQEVPAWQAYMQQHLHCCSHHALAVIGMCMHKGMSVPARQAKTPDAHVPALTADTCMAPP
jgi:hypothetical protein